MKGRRQVKAWDMDCVYVPFSGWIGKTKYLSAFEPGMLVGARRTVWVCQELQRCRVFHTTVSCVYQEWSTTWRTSSQLHTTVRSIGVNMCQHPYGTLLTPCRVHALTNLGCSEGKWGAQLNIRKVLHIPRYSIMTHFRLVRLSRALVTCITSLWLAA
jgi:hypothetical protein